jgi:hypothetical protein
MLIAGAYAEALHETLSRLMQDRMRSVLPEVKKP